MVDIIQIVPINLPKQRVSNCVRYELALFDEAIVLSNQFDYKDYDDNLGTWGEIRQSRLCWVTKRQSIKTICAYIAPDLNCWKIEIDNGSEDNIAIFFKERKECAEVTEKLLSWWLNIQASVL